MLPDINKKKVTIDPSLKPSLAKPPNRANTPQGPQGQQISFADFTVPPKSPKKKTSTAVKKPPTKKMDVLH